MQDIDEMHKSYEGAYVEEMEKIQRYKVIVRALMFIKNFLS